NAVNQLTLLLDSQQAIVRYHGALALGRVGRDAKSAIPALLNNIRNNQTWEIRKAAAGALGTIARPVKGDKNPPERTVVGALRHHLVNGVCAQVRLEAIQSLLLLGPPTDKPTKLGLTQDLQKVVRTDRDKSIRVWAQVAWMQNTEVTTDRLGFISG